MEKAMERPKKWRKDRQGVKIEARREVVDNKAKEAERKANEEADRKTKEEAGKNAREEADDPKIGK